MPGSKDTMFHRYCDAENDYLRDRVKTDIQAARYINVIIGNPVTGRYLSMEDVNLIKSLLKKITK